MSFGFQGYALIARGVRLVCTNSTGKNARSVVLKTQGDGSLKENIIMVFGNSTFSCLEPLTLSISDSWKVEGFVSKPGYGSGRNIGDRQFFFVNGRPVDMPKVGKLVNELYKGANSRQYPIVIMNFSVPTRAYDVNVTPDKRKIYFSDETPILQSLREALEKIYSSNEASYSVNRVDELNESDLAVNVNSIPEELQMPSKKLFHEEREDELCSNSGGLSPTVTDNIRELSSEKMKQKSNLSVTPNKKIEDFVADRIDKHAYVQSTSAKKGSACSENLLGSSSIVQMSLDKFVTVNKRKHESVETVLSEVPLLRSEPHTARLRLSGSLNHTPFPSSPGNCIEIDDSNNIEETHKTRLRLSSSLNHAPSPSSPRNCIDTDDSNNVKETPPVTKSKIDRFFDKSDDSTLLPCGDRQRSVLRNHGDASVLLACAENKQKRASEVHNSLHSFLIQLHVVIFHV